MNVLILYNSTQTFTNTVYEHLAGFGEYSDHRVFFAHADQLFELNVDLDAFDAVGIHFTIRLPFDQVSPSVSSALKAYGGVKFLFIQDEYDHPKRVWHWINELGIQLVFTVVPEAGITTVYPEAEFPNTRFVTNLTGYVPEKLPPMEGVGPPSTRKLMVGYRGRPLPIRYGQLGVEKIQIGQLVKAYCDRQNISNDIAWSESDRIYGDRWYEFVFSCRSMLGSESGSNVFDWDGTLKDEIQAYIDSRDNCTDQDVYRDMVQPREIDGLMNQLSPRVFEAIASKTVLVQFEGVYSGVIEPWKHFIPLKKDGSNLDEVVEKLSDDAFVDQMAEDAFQHVISSGQYSYKSFVKMVDREIDKAHKECSPEGAPDPRVSQGKQSAEPSSLTTRPIRSKPPTPIPATLVSVLISSNDSSSIGKKLALYIWSHVPEHQRVRIRPLLKQLLKRQ